jgi:membrane-associated phospholipid phosphatase
MVELVVGAAMALVAGLAWSVVVRTAPRADPARAAARHVESELAADARWSRFLRARMDATTATGLALTLAMAAVIVAGAVVGVLAAMIRHGAGVVSLDVVVTRWAAAHATTFSMAWYGWITWAGSTLVVIALATGVGVYAVRRWGSWSVALFLLLVVGGQSVLSDSIKAAIGRVRPDAPPFHVVSGPSFPSGHATAAAATWAAVALVLGRAASIRVRIVLAGAAVAIAVAVACSRVFLGAHWTSDAAGGLLVGWTWFAACAVAFGGRVLRLGRPFANAERAEKAPSTPAAAGGPPW